MYRTEPGSKTTTKPASSGQIQDAKSAGAPKRPGLTTLGASGRYKPQQIFYKSTLAVGQPGFPRPYQSEWWHGATPVLPSFENCNLLRKLIHFLKRNKQTTITKKNN